MEWMTGWLYVFLFRGSLINGSCRPMIEFWSDNYCSLDRCCCILNVEPCILFSLLCEIDCGTVSSHHMDVLVNTDGFSVSNYMSASKSLGWFLNLLSHFVPPIVAFAFTALLSALHAQNLNRPCRHNSAQFDFTGRRQRQKISRNQNYFLELLVSWLTDLSKRVVRMRRSISLWHRLPNCKSLQGLVIFFLRIQTLQRSLLNHGCPVLKKDCSAICANHQNTNSYFVLSFSATFMVDALPICIHCVAAAFKYRASNFLSKF